MKIDKTQPGEITIEDFRVAATQYANKISHLPFPSLFGVTDGKAVGTAVEHEFKEFLQKHFHLQVGNAAYGLDFPTLNLDLKVTSIKQPQSSCPFDSAIQKIYGLGYNLLIIVYDKRDDTHLRSAFLDILHVIYVDKRRTGDFSLTRKIRHMISEANEDKILFSGLVDDLDALLEDKNIPLDEISRRQLAETLIINPPDQGVLTISNALQWRLQYKRAIAVAQSSKYVGEVVELRE